MDESFGDFDPDKAGAALPTVRRALWLQLAFAACVWWAILAFLVPALRPSGLLAVIAATVSGLASMILRARAANALGVSSIFPDPWRVIDTVWYQLHYGPIALGRFWAVCRRRRADAALLIISNCAVLSIFVFGFAAALVNLGGHMPPPR
jgi:hypothetical protein